MNFICRWTADQFEQPATEQIKRAGGDGSAPGEGREIQADQRPQFRLLAVPARLAVPRCDERVRLGGPDGVRRRRRRPRFGTLKIGDLAFGKVALLLSFNRSDVNDRGAARVCYSCGRVYTGPVIAPLDWAERGLALGLFAFRLRFVAGRVSSGKTQWRLLTQRFFA